MLGMLGGCLFASLPGGLWSPPPSASCSEVPRDTRLGSEPAPPQGDRPWPPACPRHRAVSLAAGGAWPRASPPCSALIPFSPRPRFLPCEAVDARGRLLRLGLHRLTLPSGAACSACTRDNGAVSSRLSDSSAAAGAVISLNLCRLLNKHLQASGAEKPSHFCKRLTSC